MTRYVIVGNSAGSIGAIEALRQVDRQGPVTVISEEPYPAYSRPQIARLLTGEVNVEKTLFRPRAFYPALSIDLELGKAVKRVDAERRVVALADGREIAYDKLLLATGGAPIVSPAKGLAEVGYSTFMTIEDVQRLRDRLPQMKRALIVGGGLIGLSATEGLVKLGVEVTVVELAGQILGRATDAPVAEMVRRLMESRGVRILTGCSVVELRPEPGGAFTALLSNGTTVAADAFILAIGVRPRVELALAAGLTVNRGMVVDQHMRTSQADIYACGDAAEAYDYIAGGPRLTPIWPNAYLGGRIAGFNMAGREAVYDGGTTMNALHFFGLPILSAGIVSPEQPEGFRVLAQGAPGDNIYKKVVLRDGQVVGFLFSGEVERAGVIYNLMKKKMDVTAYAERLIQPNFGLITLPQAVRDEILGTRRVGAAQLERSSE
jgi:NAD(P)H-nitrite reductase large subunit